MKRLKKARIKIEAKGLEKVVCEMLKVVDTNQVKNVYIIAKEELKSRNVMKNNGRFFYL